MDTIECIYIWNICNLKSILEIKIINARILNEYIFQIGKHWMSFKKNTSKKFE